MSRSKHSRGHGEWVGRQRRMARDAKVVLAAIYARAEQPEKLEEMAKLLGCTARQLRLNLQ